MNFLRLGLVGLLLLSVNAWAVGPLDFGGAMSNESYNATTWDGDNSTGASKNAIRDQFEVVGSASVSDDSYNATTWNGVTAIAPSKNAITDKLETLDKLVAGDGDPNPAVKVDADGNVGIGTETPGCKLYVLGGNQTAIGIVDSTGSGSGLILASTEGAALIQNKIYTNLYDGLIVNVDSSDESAGSYLGIYIDSAYVAQFTAAGQLGLGTVSVNASATLDMSDADGALLLPKLTTIAKLLLAPVNGMMVYDTDLDLFQIYENGAWSSFVASGGAISSLDASDGDPAPALSVDADGNVGIGTETPGSFLHLSASAPVIYLTDTDTNATTQLVADSGQGGLYIDVDKDGNGTNPYFRLKIAGDIVQHVYSGGCFKLGEQTPTSGGSFGTNSMNGTALWVNEGNSANSTDDINPPVFVKRYTDYAGGTWPAGAAYFGLVKDDGNGSTHTVQIDTEITGTASMPAAGHFIAGLYSHVSNEAITGSQQEVHNHTFQTYTPRVDYDSVHVGLMCDVNNRYASKGWLWDWSDGWTCGVRVANESNSTLDNSCAFSCGSGWGGGKWYQGLSLRSIAYDLITDKGEGIYFENTTVDVDDAGAFDDYAACLRAGGDLTMRAMADIEMYVGDTNWWIFRTGNLFSYSTVAWLTDEGNWSVSGTMSANGAIDTNSTITAKGAAFADSFNLADSKGMYFGSPNDMIITNAVNNYIGLYNGTELHIVKNGGVEKIADFNTDGACVLYHDNIARIETAADGADVTGNLDVTGTVTGSNLSGSNTGDQDLSGYLQNLSEDLSPSLGGDLACGSYDINLNDNTYIRLGDSDDFTIAHSTNNYISTLYTKHLHIITSQGDSMADFNPTEDVVLYYNDEARFKTTPGGICFYGEAALCDYVFEDNYERLTLDEFSAYIKENKQLPNFTLGSGDGSIELDTMRKQLSEKVEEQALYILDLHERVKQLEANL